MNTTSRKSYLEQMTSDIMNYVITDEIREQVKSGNREEVEEQLFDECWIDDSITGNGSGSYYFNREAAKEQVLANMSLLMEAVHEFCMNAEEVMQLMYDENYESLDVTIRCYLLGEAIASALDKVEEEVKG